MAYRTVILKGVGRQVETLANGAVTPGHLVEWDSNGHLQVHATAGGNAQRAFAVEDELQGNEIGTAYSDNDVVFARVMSPGDEVYALLTTSQTVAIGDLLESAGDGTLRKHTADSAGAVEYPEAVVGVAKTAVTTTTSVARIVVEIV